MHKKRRMTLQNWLETIDVPFRLSFTQATLKWSSNGLWTPELTLMCYSDYYYVQRAHDTLR